MRGCRPLRSAPKAGRPRWALAEAGLDHEVRPVAGDEAEGAGYRAWQPFGQVPAYRDEAVELFGSGAIVLRVASLSPSLAPHDERGRRGRRPGPSRR